jgi:hypothetical protein
MCAVDEVLFQGRILPLRLSINSNAGLPRFQHESQKITRTSNSSSSNSSSSTIRLTNYKPKFQNNFLTCPNPKSRFPRNNIPTTNQVIETFLQTTCMGCLLPDLEKLFSFQTISFLQQHQSKLYFNNKNP